LRKPAASGWFWHLQNWRHWDETLFTFRAGTLFFK
jgi:hypothetical protein